MSAIEAVCMDCGLPYGDDRFPDLLVPHDVWKQIAPDDGLLCPNCLCARVAKANITCRAVFRSGPFFDPVGIDARIIPYGELDAETLEAAAKEAEERGYDAVENGLWGLVPTEIAAAIRALQSDNSGE